MHYTIYTPHTKSIPVPWLSLCLGLSLCVGVLLLMVMRCACRCATCWRVGMAWAACTCTASLGHSPTYSPASTRSYNNSQAPQTDESVQSHWPAMQLPLPTPQPLCLGLILHAISIARRAAESPEHARPLLPFPRPDPVITPHIVPGPTRCISIVASSASNGTARGYALSISP